MKQLVPSPLLIIIMAASLLGGAAFGQTLEEGRAQAKPLGEPKAIVSQGTDDLLWGRGRELLHTGDPLFLRGVELGENSFRESTPALEKSDRAVAYMELEELRARKLAMYDSQVAFSSPPRLSATPPLVRTHTARDLRSRSHEVAAGGEEPELRDLPQQSNRIGLYLATAGVLWLLVTLVWKRRMA